jgi:hypothetical protein
MNSDDEEEEKHKDYVLENAKQIIDGEIEPPSDFGSGYGIPIIWQLLQQSTELGALALKAFIELMKYKCCEYFRPEYILK